MKNSSSRKAFLLITPLLLIGSAYLFRSKASKDSVPQNKVAKASEGNFVSEESFFEKLQEPIPEENFAPEIIPASKTENTPTVEPKNFSLAHPRRVKAKKAPRIPAVSDETEVPLTSDAPVAPVPRLATPQVPEEFESKSYFKALMGFDYLRIDAVDKATKDTATLVSEASPHFGLSWEFLWNEEWSTELTFLMRQENYLNDSTSSKALDKTSYTRLNSSFGVNRWWNKSNKTGIFIGRFERGFLRAESATVLKLDSGVSTDLGIKHQLIFLTKKKGSAGFEITAAYLGAADTGSYKIDSGYLARGALFMRHQMKSFLLEGRASYTMWEQDSPFVTQEAKVFGTSLTAVWFFE